MKRIRIFAALAAGLLAYFGWSAVHIQRATASNDPSGTFLITITDATNGNFASTAVITLHADHSVAVVDSGQQGGTFSFSSQQGVWKEEPGGKIKARTIDWTFPYANNGSARLDYTFDAHHSRNQVQGSVVLNLFATGENPLGDNGTVAGTFNFTGTRVTIP